MFVWKHMKINFFSFYKPLLSSGASKEIPKKTNVMPNTNIIILSVSNTWQEKQNLQFLIEQHKIHITITNRNSLDILESKQILYR
jgi:hypothetical protein